MTTKILRPALIALLLSVIGCQGYPATPSVTRIFGGTHLGYGDRFYIEKGKGKMFFTPSWDASDQRYRLNEMNVEVEGTSYKYYCGKVNLEDEPHVLAVFNRRSGSGLIVSYQAIANGAEEEPACRSWGRHGGLAHASD